MLKTDKAYEVYPTRVAHKMKRIGYAEHVEVVSRRTGEVRDTVAVVNEPVTVDASGFIKLYKPEALSVLSITAIRVFLYLLSGLSYEGIVDISIDLMKDELGFKSPKSVRDALAELRKNDIIRRKAINEYWVNPNVACKGTRKINQ